jgi:hypothetical protein
MRYNLTPFVTTDLCLPAKDSPASVVKQERFGEWIPFCLLSWRLRLPLAGGQLHLYQNIFMYRSVPLCTLQFPLDFYNKFCNGGGGGGTLRFFY